MTVPNSIELLLNHLHKVSGVNVGVVQTLFEWSFPFWTVGIQF